MIDPIALPTVGRIVHLHDPDHIDPFPAIVVGVGPGKLSIAYLHVFLHDGARALEDVAHASEAHDGEPYWDWMPYQKGQAAKTEELQAALDKQREKLSEQKQRAQIHEERFQKMGELHTHPHLGPGGPERAVALDNEMGSELSKTQASTPSREDGKR